MNHNDITVEGVATFGFDTQASLMIGTAAPIHREHILT